MSHEKDSQNRDVHELSVCHINIRSLSGERLNDLKIHIRDHYDIITLSETWLSNNINNDNLVLEGYQEIYRCDRTTGAGGGVAVYVRNGISVSEIRSARLDLEILWLEVRLFSSKIILCTAYRPPTVSDFWIKVHDIYNGIANLYSNDSHFILLGDFNSDPNTTAGKRMSDFCELNSLQSIVTEPTRITPTSSTVLDQIICSCYNMLKSVCVHPPVSSNDHCTVSAVFNFKVKREQAYERYVWAYNDGDYVAFRYALLNCDWSDCFDKDTNIDSIYDKWKKQFLCIAKSHIPYKKVTIRPRDPPWYSSELRRMYRKRHRLYRKAAKTNRPDHWELYSKSVVDYKKACNDRENEYNLMLASKLEQQGNSGAKYWWKLAKSFMYTKNSPTNMPNLIDPANNKILTSNVEKAECLNNYFLTQSELPPRRPQLPPHIDYQDEPLLEISITEQEVADALKLLNPNKASGPDEIPARLLKEAGNTIVTVLTKLFNLSLETATVPTEWKMANIVPIYKKGDKQIVSNYRPISLLSVVSKIFEKIIFKHLFNHLRDNKLLSKLQSGFVPNDSTICQLVYLCHVFTKALDDKQDIQVAFCDISKAFDRVWHEGLIFKLKKCGIQGKLLHWFCHYLHGRKQRVNISGTHSTWGPIKAGVPQGSTLGPLMFLVYINDITDNITGNIRLFADDTILFQIDDPPGTSSQTLNNDLQTIHKWAEQWIVTFNPEKTELLHITNKRSSQDMPPVFFNNVQVENVKTHKHLGLILNKNLSWTAHIDEIATKAAKRLSLLNKSKNLLSRQTLEIMYKSYVRPTMEYGSLIWHNCTASDSDRLENLQLQAARIVTGAPRGTSHANLYNEVGWQTLASRRENSQLVMFFKIINNLAPEYLCQLAPPCIANLTQYNLRNRNNLSVPNTRTENFKNSFINHASRLWNELDADLRNSNTISQFKSRLQIKSSKQISIYYYLGTRKVNILLSQLRLGMSSLGQHLVNRHLSNDGSCSCGNGVESTCHYFLYCTNYTHLRATMLAEMSELFLPHDLNTILQGLYVETPNLITLHNIVENYIKNSKRFE